MPKRLVQAYRQAPWRIQTQRGVLFLIVAVLGASILWVLVSVTVQAASAGLEIQVLETKQEELQRQIAELRTNIAIQTAQERMEQRAGDLGFAPTNPGDITYVVAPGYSGRQPDIQASPPGYKPLGPVIKPVYSQTLWDWLVQGVIDMSEQAGGFTP
jgi:cell division protein FtsB